MARRPSLTPKQRAYAKRQRAQATLIRAAVRYSVEGDKANDGLGGYKDLSLAFADLTAACDRYANVLTAREKGKLCRRR